VMRVRNASPPSRGGGMTMLEVPDEGIHDFSRGLGAHPKGPFAEQKSMLPADELSPPFGGKR
jgi:hypothetical protein